MRAMLTRRRSGDDCQTVGWKEYDQRVSLLGPSDGPSARPHVHLVWFLYVNFQHMVWSYISWFDVLTLPRVLHGDVFLLGSLFSHAVLQIKS